MSKIIPNDFSINSLVGETTTFSGEFESSGPFRIDGRFIGKINSFGKVFVGKNGFAEGMVIAKTVIIGGTFKGDIFAEENVAVLKTGKIIGNIYSSSVNMEDGVLFDGECKVLSKQDMKDLLESKRKEKYNYGETK
ncbi:MAG TPA: polymer-forming cytoskeletal protein [Spirochaetota bacterium]|nr:polymer-forming cytoskeletal protein [Spirochaetota bacterium]